MIHIYKPNSKNTGCAASFNCGYINHKKDKEELTVFLQVILQHSWNDKTKNGSFQENKDNPEKTAVIKLNDFEVGEIISAIKNYRAFSAFHSFNEDKTTISLTTWDKSENEKWFGLTIKRNGISFKMPITSGEAEVVRVFLEGVLLTKFRNYYAKKKD